MKTIPHKIVKHLASEAYCQLQNAIGEAKELSRKPQFSDRSTGVGLDLSVLQEKLAASLKFVELLK